MFPLNKVEEAATQRAALTMATDQLRRMQERTARPELHQHIERALFFLSNINPERLIAPDDEVEKLRTENQELKNMLAKKRGL